MHTRASRLHFTHTLKTWRTQEKYSRSTNKTDFNGFFNPSLDINSLTHPFWASASFETPPLKKKKKEEEASPMQVCRVGSFRIAQISVLVVCWETLGVPAQACTLGCLLVKSLWVQMVCYWRIVPFWPPFINVAMKMTKFTIFSPKKGQYLYIVFDENVYS